MLEPVLSALQNSEAAISSIVGILTLCAAIWGALRIKLFSRPSPETNSHASGFSKRPKTTGSWKKILNLGLNEHSQLEELVSVRTANVVFFCLLTLSFPWFLISLFSIKSVTLTVINFCVFSAALFGFVLQRAGATLTARWLAILISAVYWLGCMLTVGALQGTEYFLAALLALPVLILSRAQTGQLILSTIFLSGVFFLGVRLTDGVQVPQVLDEQALLIGYHVNALFLAAIIFASVSYYKGFATSSYQLLTSKKIENDALVSKLFPSEIAQKIINQEATSAQWHPEGSVLLGTLTGFSQLYSRLPAIDLVTKLDELYSRFDELIELHDVDKVKTLGTSYVAATGLNTAKKNYFGIADCALAMHQIVDEFARAHNLPIGFRCCLATGLTISGVIEKSRPRFDIWGEALDSAAGLQTQAKEGQILVNQTMYWRLNKQYDLTKINTQCYQLVSKSAPDESLT